MQYLVGEAFRPLIHSGKMGKIYWSYKLFFGPSGEKQYKYCTSGGDPISIPDREGC